MNAPIRQAKFRGRSRIVPLFPFFTVHHAASRFDDTRESCDSESCAAVSCELAGAKGNFFSPSSRIEVLCNGFPFSTFSCFSLFVPDHFATMSFDADALASAEALRLASFTSADAFEIGCKIRQLIQSKYAGKPAIIDIRAAADDQQVSCLRLGAVAAIPDTRPRPPPPTWPLRHPRLD